MKFKDSVRTFIDDYVGEVTLAQVIAVFPDKTPAAVRGTLNFCVNNGLITRVKRGVYTKRIIETIGDEKNG